MGECGARLAICSGSMLEAYAAYSATLAKANSRASRGPAEARIAGRAYRGRETTFPVRTGPRRDFSLPEVGKDGRCDAHRDHRRRPGGVRGRARRGAA